jgi:hypothetical protein
MALPFDDHIAARLIEHGLETVLVEFARPHFSSREIDDPGGGRLAEPSRPHQCIRLPMTLVRRETA